VDVFTAVPYKGNPLAVVAGADGLTTEEMQRLAAWTNLSETTFLLEPTSGKANRGDGGDRTDRGDEADRGDTTDGADRDDRTDRDDEADRTDTGDEGDRADRTDRTDRGDYRVRIFTPDRELPFAGHPTLGTCRVWLDQGGIPRRSGVIVQECGAGLVTIRTGGGRLAFAAPPLVRSGPVSDEDLAAACALAGIDLDSPDTPVVDANWVDNGPPWMGILLRSAEEVLALRPQAANPQDLFVGVVGPHPPGSAANSADLTDGCDFEVRAFFPKHGVLTEDPVTGSLNASLGQWLTAAGHATAPYTASQGAALGCDGRIYIERDSDGTIWVGGDVVTCIQGTVDI
jgi:PhzF family phenazine biosynthesis protein